MSGKGDYPAARTRNQCGSEGNENSDPSAPAQASQEIINKENKNKTRQRSENKGRGRPRKTSGVNTKDLIDKYLKPDPNSLRTHSVSSRVYSTTLVVHPSESETDTCERDSSPHIQSSVNKVACQSSIKALRSEAVNTQTNSINTTSCSTVNGSKGFEMSIAESTNVSSMIIDGIKAVDVPTLTTSTIVQSEGLMSNSTAGEVVYVTASTSVPSLMKTWPINTVPATSMASLQFPRQYTSHSCDIQTTEMGTQMWSQFQQTLTTPSIMYAGQNPIVVPEVTVASSADISDITKLTTTVMGVHGQVLNINSKQIDLGSRLDGLEFEQEQDHNSLKQSEKAIRYLEDKVQLMSAIMAKQDSELELLKKRVREYETKGLKQCIKLVGLLEDGNVSLTQQVKDFFKDQMKIQQEIQTISVTRMKSGNPPAVVIKVADIEQKKAIFEHVKNLKNVQNAEGKSYGVFNMLTEETLKKDIRKRQIKKDSMALPVAQCHKVTLNKGTLVVDNAIYHPKYDQLTTKDLLELTPKDWIRCNELKTAASTVNKVSGSAFQGFVIPVHNLEEVRRSYKHFKLRFAGASHIMMAYRLPGTNKAYDEDNYDDGEFGSGRRLYRILSKENMFSIMAVLIRFNGRSLLGPKRFEAITNASKEALARYKSEEFEVSLLKLRQRMDLSVVHKRKPRNKMGIRPPPPQPYAAANGVRPVGAAATDRAVSHKPKRYQDGKPTLRMPQWETETKTKYSLGNLPLTTPYLAYNRFQMLAENSQSDTANSGKFESNSASAEDDSIQASFSNEQCDEKKNQD